MVGGGEKIFSGRSVPVFPIILSKVGGIALKEGGGSCSFDAAASKSNAGGAIGAVVDGVGAATGCACLARS